VTATRLELRIDRVVVRGQAMTERDASAFRGALEVALADRLSGIDSVRAGLVPGAVTLGEPFSIGADPGNAAGRIADAVAGALRGQATASGTSPFRPGARHG
jgi:hypothetical protein